MIGFRLVAIPRLALIASNGAAQAVCSAPHSSPTLSRAGIGIQSPGSGWIQVTGYHARSDEFVGPDGDSRPFLSEGRATTSSAYFTAAGGVVRGIEFRVQPIEDRETRSTWDVDGLSRSGPLRGERLEPVAEAWVAFWFAWAAFHPTTRLWTASR